MADEKRLINAKDFDLRVSKRKMTEIFPNWNELPKETQDAVCKHGQYLRMLLETQPTVDAVEVVHGHWCWEGRFRACSECGSYVEFTETLGASHWKY